MKRLLPSNLLPSSLLGQVMLSVALALMVAQVVSVTLLYRAGEERRDAAIMTAAAFQLVNGAEREERISDRRAERRARRAERRGQGQGNRRPESAQPERPSPRPGAGGAPGASGGAGGLPRILRYTVTQTAPIAIADAASDDPRIDRLREILAVDGIEPHTLAVAVRRAGTDPVLLRFAETRPRFQRRTEWRDRNLYLVAIRREAGGVWETARILDPQRPQAAMGVLLFQTFVTCTFLIVILFLILRRITRPLAQLTQRVGDFSRQPDKAVLLEESGPADTRRLIAAHNAMEARIAALLDEKDVMLGAIGHDLKTPLAALRVRIESVADDAQRKKMADSVEDITVTLDDILALARVGHVAAQAREPVDLGALAMGVVEEFEDLGEPVTFTDAPRTSAQSAGRVVAKIQETWTKRALRNLVSNAVRYGEAAEVSIIVDGRHAVLRVDDRGPGIAPEDIAAMMEPFTRGDASRNRATGGAGLGLTLARAIAQQHGGELVLRNRNENGLRAELKLPL